MSATVFKEVSYSLSKLIEDIDIGEIGLPDIQRPFVWPNTKVRDLLDSMYRGFPVGNLVFWVNGQFDAHRQIGDADKQKLSRLLIVDGQQRLTSLYAVMKGIPVVRKNYRSERIYIAFRPSDQTFHVANAATRRDPEFIPDISELWSKETTEHKFLMRFLDRLREGRPLSESEEDRISEAIGRVYHLQSYPFTAIEISSTVEEEHVAEVFVRINSALTPLKLSDFILTLMSVFWDEGRSQLEEFCRLAREPSTSGPSPFNYFIQPEPAQLLRVAVAIGFRRARLQHVYSILRGKDLETEQFSEERRIQQFTVLREAQTCVLDLNHWHDFLKVLLRAGYRSNKMISSETGLLYTYAMYLIGKQDYGLDEYTLRNVMARWYFMTALTGRYTSSPETVMERDLAGLRNVSDATGFITYLDRIIADTFTEDYWSITMPNQLATSSARSPAFFAYCAALSLLDARVLFSKIKVSELLDPGQQATKSAIERHHLFPKGYLAQHGIHATRDINQIANYALVEWPDNVGISDSPPVEYFPKYLERLSDEELANMQYWHALPGGWEEMTYEDFLVVRRGLMANIIRDGFSRLCDQD